MATGSDIDHNLRYMCRFSEIVVVEAVERGSEVVSYPAHSNIGIFWQTTGLAHHILLLTILEGAGGGFAHCLHGEK